MALYSEKVMDHFQHPRNVGIIENADGIGEVGNAKCGDIMQIYLKIDDDKNSDVKFETLGCCRGAGLPARVHDALLRAGGGGHQGSGEGLLRQAWHRLCRVQVPGLLAL